MEDEMAARIEVIEKLRTQVRDLEKEKRDIQRRYNEQVLVSIFDLIFVTYTVKDYNFRGRTASFL